MKGAGITQWVLACEVARGLLRSGATLSPNRLIRALTANDGVDEEKRGWARLTLSRQNTQKDPLRFILDRVLGDLSDEKLRDHRGHESRYQFAAELLVQPHGARAEDLAAALRRSLPATTPTAESITRARQGVGAALSGDFAELDLALTDLASGDDRYGIALAVLRRTLCWPLFDVLNGRAETALWLPVAILLREEPAAPSGEPSVELLGLVASDRGGLVGPLRRAARAGLGAWRAKYGRVNPRSRDEIIGSTIIFDFGPTDAALSLLPDRGLADRMRTGLAAREQRSLEAYLAVGVLARLLGMPYASQSIATGTVASPPDGTLICPVIWPEPAPEDLWRSINRKAAHVGSTRAFANLIVPRTPSAAYQRLIAQVEQERKAGRDMPYVVSVDNVEALADQALVGDWKPYRFYRCGPPESIALLRPDEERRVFLETISPCVYIHAPGAGVEAARKIAAHLVARNRQFLEMGREGDDRAPGNAPRQVPSQIGFLVFRAVEGEQGLAVFGALLEALCGTADGARLRELEAQPDGVASARKLAEWLEHPFDRREPWEAPEVLILYGTESLRAASAWMSRRGEESVNPYSVLRALPLQLRTRVRGRVVGDDRHHEHLGVVRVIVVDGARTPDEAFRREGWHEAVVHPGKARVEPPSQVPGPALLALGMLQTWAPAATIARGWYALADWQRRRVQDQAGAEFRVNDDLLADELRAIVASQLVSRRAGWFLVRDHLRVGIAREFDRLPAGVRVRARLAMVESLAPWLGLGRWVRDEVRALTPADEWLLAERLNEVRQLLYEIHKDLKKPDCEIYWLGQVQSPARGMRGTQAAPREESPPPSRVRLKEAVRTARLGLLRVLPLGVVSRLYWVRRLDTNARAAWDEWNEAAGALSGASLAQRSFGFIMAGALAGFSCVGRSKGGELHKEILKSLRDPILPALQRAVRVNTIPDSPARRWRRTMSQLFMTAHRVQSGQVIDSGIVARLAGDCEALLKAGVIMQSATEAIETIGDELYCKGRIDAAADWYLLGACAAPEYSQCATKLAAIAPGRVPDGPANSAGFSVTSLVSRYRAVLDPVVKQGRLFLSERQSPNGTGDD